MRDYRVVVLGAGGVGKSALTVQFVEGVYVESYDPTIEDSYRKTTMVDQRKCSLEILDTAGVEQFTAMRELYIKNGEGFILVYSVTEQSSLKELEGLRDQVLRIKDSFNVPIVLVGNKCDLNEARCISMEEGVRLANSWGKTPFYETSAKHRSNVEEVFIDLIRQIMRRDCALEDQAQESISASQPVSNAHIKEEDGNLRTRNTFSNASLHTKSSFALLNRRSQIPSARPDTTPEPRKPKGRNKSNKLCIVI